MFGMHVHDGRRDMYGADDHVVFEFRLSGGPDQSRGCQRIMRIHSRVHQRCYAQVCVETRRRLHGGDPSSAASGAFDPGPPITVCCP